MSKVIAWITMCSALGVAACGPAPEPEPAPAPKPGAGGERTTQEETLASHMRLNFMLATQMRDAITQGNLPIAQKRAHDLGHYDYSKELPAHWMKDVEKMQTAARDVAQAGDLATAARNMAVLAATCGDCHARLPIPPPEATAEHGFSSKGPESLKRRMARHERAADGMWFGLTIPSDASWRGGARALTEAPLAAPQVDGRPIDPALDAKMETVRDLGRRALEAEQQSERIAVYGDLIASCAGCHTDL